MKTLLFAPLFLDEGERLQRNKKWIDYYIPLQEKLGYDEILFVDNASGPILKEFEDYIKKYNNVKITIIKKTIRLSRITEHAYSFWYRAFGEAAKYAMENSYDSIIHCDSDVYLFTDEICEYVKNIKTGWNCFYCSIHNYNETTFQVIGSNKFQKMYEFMTEEFLTFYPYKLAEHEIPFTNICKDFKGDRYGEKNLPQDDSMHWYGQCPVNIPMTFKGKL